MSEDRQLLEKFCRTGSETAFRELVEQHLKLVYSVAMRMANGDAHLAQDISQIVFSNLARKAHSLPADVVLAGWLHQDTRFTALEFLRKERRRVNREKEAALMYEMEASEPEVDWSRVRPVLDEALGELHQEDRHALLLRFFGERNLAQVGAALGIAEDAARKRVGRALDKLRVRLSSRGITTTASALSLALTTHAGETVPPGLGAQLAHVAFAASGAGTTTITGIITAMSSAKITSLLITAAVLLMVSGVALKLHKDHAESAPPHALVASDSSSATRGDAASLDTTRESSPPRPDPRAGTARNPELALARIQAVLDDPTPTRRWPNRAMEDAIAALGNQRGAAVPLLRQALKSPDPQVRARAAGGLGAIGPGAREAVPDLLALLRTSNASSDPPSSIMLALSRMGPLPEIVPDLVQILRDNPATREAIANNLGNIIAGNGSAGLNEAARPLLQDPDPQVRAAAAYALAGRLSNEAGPDVVSAAIEALGSSDDGLRTMGLMTLKDVGFDPRKPDSISSDRLGPGVTNAVPALVGIVNNGSSWEQRMQALKLLDAIQPGLRDTYPTIGSLLQGQEQDAVFAQRIAREQVSLSDLIDGLGQHPGAVVATAKALADMGPEAQPALPVLQSALGALEPQASAAPADRRLAYAARDAVVNAIQKIDPDQPKPLFTGADMESLSVTLQQIERQEGSSMAQRLASVLQPFWSSLPSGGMEVTPDQMRTLLSTVKGTDQAAYSSLVAAVKQIDPRFVEAPTR